MQETLYISPTTIEHVEMYLKAIWIIDESGENIAKINRLSKLLSVTSPSAVQMLKKMAKQGLIKYFPRQGVELTKEGKTIGRRMVRYGRLIEKLMTDRFKITIDVKTACGIEHHMTDKFADAICTFLNHPKMCPHKKIIPKGKCCLKK